MTDTRTFHDAMNESIHILGTKVPTTQGRFCSPSNLVGVTTPNASMKLYIGALQSQLDTEGTFAEGIAYAIDLLATRKVARSEQEPFDWTLVSADLPSVGNQLYMAEILRLVSTDG